MKIRRNIKGEEVELELTQDELYEASRQNGRCRRCLLEILQN